VNLWQQAFPRSMEEKWLKKKKNKRRRTCILKIMHFLLRNITNRVSEYNCMSVVLQRWLKTDLCIHIELGKAHAVAFQVLYICNETPKDMHGTKSDVCYLFIFFLERHQGKITSVGKNYVKEEESLTKIGFEVGYVESLL